MKEYIRLRIGDYLRTRRVIVESDSLVAVKKIINPLQETDPLSQAILQCKQFLSNWNAVLHASIWKAKQNNWTLTIVEQPPIQVVRCMHWDFWVITRARSCVT